MKSNINDTITHFFFNLLNYQPEITIEQSDQEISVQINLEPQESGVIIGYRGEVLASIQLILSLMIQHQLNQWLPVRVNINDYKEQRLKTLENLAHNSAAKALQTGRTIVLSRLSSYERRVIHSTLSQHSDVTTHSEGDASNRVLLVSPKS